MLSETCYFIITTILSAITFFLVMFYDFYLIFNFWSDSLSGKSISVWWMTQTGVLHYLLPKVLLWKMIKKEKKPWIMLKKIVLINITELYKLNKDVKHAWYRGKNWCLAQKLSIVTGEDWIDYSVLLVILFQNLRKFAKY